MRKILAAAAAVIALTATVWGITQASAPSASATSAHPAPVMYSGMGGGWQDAARRPQSFVVGVLWGVKTVSWSRWSDTAAYGRGHLLACASAAGPCIDFRAGVRLSDVRTHDGTRYFAAMTLTGKGHATQRLVMDQAGGWILTTRGYGAP